LTVDKASAPLGDQVTFTAKVTGGSSTPTPTGTVTFNDNGADGATVPLTDGSATWAPSDLPAGEHHVIAYFSSNGTYLAGASPAVTTKIVGLPSATTIKADHPQVQPGVETVTYTVSVTDAAPGAKPAAAGAATPPSGRVTVLVDGTALGTALLDDKGQGTFSTHALSAGSHKIVARFDGDTRFDVSSSAPLTQKVVAANQTPTDGGTTVIHGRSVPAPKRPELAAAGTAMLPETGPVVFTLLGIALGLLVTGASLMVLGARQRVELSRRVG
jgi:hypothetical protein